MDCQMCPGPDARWRYSIFAHMVICDPCHQYVQDDQKDKLRERRKAMQPSHGIPPNPIDDILDDEEFEDLYKFLRRAQCKPL